MTSFTENGVVLYKMGRLVALFVTNPTVDDDGKTILNISDPAYQPTREVQIFSKIWNGSGYVDCMAVVAADGKVSFAGLQGGAIENIDTRYFKTKPIFYISKH